MPIVVLCFRGKRLVDLPSQRIGPKPVHALPAKTHSAARTGHSESFFWINFGRNQGVEILLTKRDQIGIGGIRGGKIIDMTGNKRKIRGIIFQIIEHFKGV